MKVLAGPPKIDVLDREQAEHLAAQVRGESKYLTSVYVNSHGKAFVNVTDPKRERQPFTLRDRMDWEDHRPRRERKSDNPATTKGADA